MQVFMWSLEEVKRFRIAVVLRILFIRSVVVFRMTLGKTDPRLTWSKDIWKETKTITY